MKSMHLPDMQQPGMHQGALPPAAEPSIPRALRAVRDQGAGDQAEYPAMERSRYSGTSPGSRSLALTLALALHALAGLVLLVKWGHDQFIAARPQPLVATFEVAAAPPEPQKEVPEGPEQAEQKEQIPDRQQDRPIPDIPPPAIPPVLTIASPPRAEAVPAADAVPETTAPKTLDAPPAPRMASNAAENWQAQVLARLEQFRRYPAASRARREQGVAHIRFSMDRQGRLLGAELVRSSGSRRLDKAAMATLERAAPFPVPPEEIAGQIIRLTVPVEFFLR